MSPRDLGIWSAAFVLSLLLHGTLLLNSGSRMGAEMPVTEKRTAITRVSFRSVAAAVPESEPVPEIVEPPPEPPKPKPKPKPEPKPVVKPKPEPEPVPEVVEPVEETPAPVEVPLESAVPMAVAGQAVNDPALVERARDEYLRRLFSQIESHKHYPPAARRRGIEGGITVTFQLQPGGRLERLHVAGGHSVLQSAAEGAVRAALPFPDPPESMTLPLDISFTIIFSLR